jgi:diguanylate cyclase (GGDEF)-like protein
MRHVAPSLWSAVLVYLVVLGFTLASVHLLAMRLLVEQPLARIVASLKRAEQGDFLQRAPVVGEDELAELARSFNTALAAITDLHARRLEDAHSMESMQRELELKAELEAQHRLLDEANRRLEGRLRELTLAADLARTVASTLRLDELLRFVTDHVGRTFGYDAFALLLLDEDGQTLTTQSAFNAAPDMEGRRIRVGEGAAGWAVQERQLLVIRDTRAETRFPVDRLTRGQHGSVLAVPMIHQGRCVGVLDFFRALPDAFGEDEVRFLESVAANVAMAIANARLHEQTLALSLTDPLTGIHNRRSLFGRLEQELERSERFAHACAVAMIDVDHFKGLNDAHGHLAGDTVLRRVAELLGGAVRKVDTLARHGGEEFALVLPRADRAAALEVAEKLRRVVASAHFEHGETQPGGRITVSIGVASFPEDATDLSTLVDCADAALYAAKRQGRNTTVAFAPGMRENPGRKRDVRVTARVEPGTV